MTYPHWNKTPSTETDWFEALTGLARYLRGPDGCPWDREQSMADFASYAREEADELVEAVASGDNSHIQEEFGDVLFVLLATAVAAEQEGRFSLREALDRAHQKMIRRHAHVFGGARAETPQDAVDAWNRVKQDEKQ
ncbi:MAG: hypothetical protein JXR94_13680 [Candidatus Hydrogenedentes bacterium]|nr:hypothetical protein [Candidatus Hydrogenedentota bacterium]